MFALIQLLSSVVALTFNETVKIAFFGDQGYGPNSEKVLQMIKNWNPEFVMIAGDFDYIDSPSLFMSQNRKILGDSFPFLAAVGNHDILKWYGKGGYQDLLVKQLAASPLHDHCFGDYGVNSYCLLDKMVFYT